ncbi:cellulose binding domain-containing protein [Deinococcus aquaedulcis]|uniref:cellulose binding domain-containing protein n=1 Tax=Deinococcus aquaedulcis TaxID=2840455 RepID=UPI002E29E96D|nr:glycosyl hydrolase family 18 protein [Deinococcus aquaedulcis]
MFRYPRSHPRPQWLLTALLALAACSQVPNPGVPQATRPALQAQATGLTATFDSTGAWDTGFTGRITLRNPGTTAITGWTLKFKFNGNAAAGASVWGAGGSIAKDSTGLYTITPNSWGGATIPAGGSVTIGYDGTGQLSGVNTCTLNGASCSGTTTPPTGDTTAPTVSLTASPSTVTSAGTVSLSAAASDNVGVTKVEFYQGSTLLSTDTTAPYTATETVSSANNGTRTYTAKAFDAASNTRSASASVTVNISGTTPPPPTGKAIYVGYAGTWQTSVGDLTTSNIPPYYTDLNLSFARPDTTYVKGSYAFDQAVAGFEFAEGASTPNGQRKFTAAQAQTLRNNIAALKARGTRVWVSVGGWSYSQGSQWSNFNAARVVDLAQDLGASGVDIDWESSGSNCNKLDAAQFACTKDAEIKSIINTLDAEIAARGLDLQISIAGWSTGAYYVKGTPWEEGKVQWGSPFGGTMYRVVRDLGAKIDRVNLMSYDGGTYYDPREGYESYRAIYSGPIAMGLEVAPEGSGGAILKLNAEPGTVYDAEMNTGTNNEATRYYNVETLATYMKNKGRPGDGMMLWQIWKERVYAKPPAGAAGVNATGQKVCQMLAVNANCSGTVPDLPPAP